jgi:prepilin-type N-terminal cleavage/methylation domain-containing protein
VPDRRQITAARAMRGLTLGEMLIVLAVFSILAAMFLISSRFALNKSRYSRALHEERELTGRLDLFVADNLLLPGEQGLNALLRDPRGVSYMNSIPVDPFASPAPGDPGHYLYFTYLSPQQQSIIVSVGPDGKNDIGPALEQLRQEKNKDVISLAGASQTRSFLFKDVREEKDFIIQHTYDPTNGSDSPGDIIHYYSAPNVVIGN